METLAIVELEVRAEAAPGGQYAAVVLQIDLFVLDCPPQPLHKHVVQRSAAAVHADPDFQIEQTRREVEARELRSLIAVEDLRLPPLQRPVERRQAEAGVQRDRDLPRE